MPRSLRRSRSCGHGPQHAYTPVMDTEEKSMSVGLDGAHYRSDAMIGRACGEGVLVGPRRAPT